MTAMNELRGSQFLSNFSSPQSANVYTSGRSSNDANCIRLMIATIAVALLAVGNVPAGLIAYWTLDNNTTGLQNLGSDGATSDLTIPAASATIGGGPTFTASGGPMGGYATFDGNQALVASAAGNAADDLTDYPFTLAAWYRPATHTTLTLRGAADWNLELGRCVDLLHGRRRNAQRRKRRQAVRRNTAFQSTEGVGTSSTVFNGSWHHIAVVNSSDTSSMLYLDGVQVGQSATSVTFSSAVNTITVGAFLRSAGYIDKFYGDIDDAQIYDTALSPSEVLDLVPEPASLVGRCSPPAWCRRGGFAGTACVIAA